jgi:hypothetical protein
MKFKEWLEEQEELDEGMWDTAKKWGRNSALAGTMAMTGMGGMSHQGMSLMPQQPVAQKQMDPVQIKSMFDGYTQEKPTMSSEQWKDYAKYYPSKGKHGFVPNPKSVGGWIPAGGADSVHVQSITQVNGDELTRDDIGMTPWKDGKAMGATKWNHSGKEQTPYGTKKSNTTTTPFDGEALYQQAMQR